MFVQLQLAAQQSGGSQLQHRHLITRGNAETAVGQPTGQPRVPHPHPHSHHHSHPHSHHGSHLSQPHPVPSSPSSPGSPSFPMPSTHHQPLPPMYHQSPSSTHLSPPTPPPSAHSPRPSHIPGGVFRSPSHHHHHHHHYHQPSSGQPSHDIGQVSPVAPVLCSEVSLKNIIFKLCYVLCNTFTPLSLVLANFCKSNWHHRHEWTVEGRGYGPSAMHISKSSSIKLIKLEGYPSSIKENLWFTQFWRRFAHGVCVCVRVCTSKPQFSHHWSVVYFPNTYKQANTHT